MRSAPAFSRPGGTVLHLRTLAVFLPKRIVTGSFQTGYPALVAVRPRWKSVTVPTIGPRPGARRDDGNQYSPAPDGCPTGRRRADPLSRRLELRLNRQVGDAVFHPTSLGELRHRLEEHQQSAAGFHHHFARRWKEAGLGGAAEPAAFRLHSMMGGWRHEPAGLCAGKSCG